ncbi:MAG: YfhO family protein [Candidatus Daviesbacteria bacterium]|nr:YfhO family protein [Candidatus Daviesbacteria bacterium]
MKKIIRKIYLVTQSRYFPFLVLLLFAVIIYYKLFLFNQIPFPGDLLVASYSPWFDYYKIPVQNPLISDVFSQFFLWKYLSVDIIKTAQWPLWNPYSFAGTPFLATYHSATLFPLNFLLILPKYTGWGLFIFSQTLISLITMYLLLSLWTKSPIARITGSIIFALGGLMTTWLELGTAGHALSFLPLSLFAIEKYFSDFKSRYLFLLIFALSLIILAGHAQISTYSFIILFSYIVVTKFKDNQFKNYHLITPIIAILTTIPLLAIQILPSLDLLNKSIRVSETYIEQSNFGLLPLQDFLKFYMADFFGHPVTRNYWGYLNYSETSGFLGSLSIPLILLALIYLKKDRRVAFFIYLFIFSLVFVFENPISKLIYQLEIPILTSSFASRMLFIISFSGAILSAFALDSTLNSRSLSRLTKTSIWVFSAIIGAILGIILSYLFLKVTIMLSPSDSLVNHLQYDITNFKVSLKNSILPFSLVSLFVLFLLLKQKINFFHKYQFKLIGLILLFLVSFDLGRYFIKFNPFVNQNLIFPEIHDLTVLKKQPGIFRVGREHAEVFPPNTWMAYGVQSFEGYDPIYLESYAKFMNFLNTGNFQNAAVSRYAELSSSYQSPFLDILNAKYFVGILRDKEGRIPGDELYYKFKDTDYQIIYKGKSFVILKNPNALERAYFAKSIIIEPVNAEGLLSKANFNPKEITVLSENLDVTDITGDGEIKITDYSPNSVRLETKTTNEEILILADQYEDGWRATLDGEETKISKANLIFRAIKVPAGHHEIIFSYLPKSFETGLMISILTIITLLAITIISVKRKSF